MNQPRARRLRVNQPFRLDNILDGTQDFRWRRREDGWHSGVLAGNLLHVRQVENVLEYRARSDLDALLTSYFRLDEDIEAMQDGLAACDPTMSNLIKSYPYARVLRQPDPWETTVAYICSANGSLERITARIENILDAAGAHQGTLLELDGETRRAFPTADELLTLGVEKLSELRLGLRLHEKIIGAAARVSNGSLDLQRLARSDVSCEQAVRELQACYGVGPKMSNCIALFSLDKPDAFPIDRHIRSAMKRHYFPGESASDAKMTRFAQERFGKRAGYAAELLFLDDYERSKRQRAVKSRRQRSRRR